MKAQIESTIRIVDVNGTEMRLWQGTTEAGVDCYFLIARVAVAEGQDQTQFERELLEQAAPRPQAVQCFPLRMIL